MTWISFVCFLFCLGIVCSCLQKRADIFSPARVFGFVWSLSIGLAELKFSSLQYHWSSFGWIVLILGIGSFLLGCYVLYILYLPKKLAAIQDIRRTVHSQNMKSAKMFRIVTFLFFVYALCYAVAASVKGFIPLFTINPGYARTHFTVFGVGLPILAAPTIMFLIVEYLIVVEGETIRKIMLGGILVCTAISYFFLIQRYDFAFWITVSLVFMFYGSRYIRPGRVLVIVASFIVIFYWIQSIRAVGQVEYLMFVLSKMKFDIRFASLTEPYMYTVMNVENFVHAVERLDHHTFGYFTFNFVMSLSGLKHWLEDYFHLIQTPYLTSGYNMYSFLWPFYRDFGMIGMAVFAFVEGALISWLYYSMRSNPTLLTIVMYSLAVFLLITSLLHFAPGLLNVVMDIMILYVVNRVITIPQKKTT